MPASLLLGPCTSCLTASFPFYFSLSLSPLVFISRVSVHSAMVKWKCFFNTYVYVWFSFHFQHYHLLLLYYTLIFCVSITHFCKMSDGFIIERQGGNTLHTIIHVPELNNNAQWSITGMMGWWGWWLGWWDDWDDGTDHICVELIIYVLNSQKWRLWLMQLLTVNPSTGLSEISTLLLG